MAETDEEIYRRYLAQGSENDLRALLLRHREGLTLFAAGVVGNLDDGEEVMLDAFAVVASGTSRFDGRSSFRTWLFAIARKLAANRVRRRRFMLLPLDERPDEEVSSSDFVMLQEERNRQLYKALDSLTPDYRQALFLIYLEEMSVEETARIMGKSAKQVYNLAYRGKQALKEALERTGFTDAID